MNATTDPAARDLLTLVQWLSPAFPLGSFAFSHGLEQAVAAGDVGDAAGVESWLRPVLGFGSGWCDAVLLSLTHRDAAPLADLAALGTAMAASRERQRETMEQGNAFLRTTKAILGAGDPLPPQPLPVAVGLQARRLALPTATVVALYLQAFAGNLVTIATRIVPLGQTEAQACLARLAPAIAALAERAATAVLDDLASGTFRSDLAALRHETLEVRLFQS